MTNMTSEKITQALGSIEASIAHCHERIATLEEMRELLRVAQVWPGGWSAESNVRVVAFFEAAAINPLDFKRFESAELRQKLHAKLAKSTLKVAHLTDGYRIHPITKLEYAYIKGYVDTLEKSK